METIQLQFDFFEQTLTIDTPVKKPSSRQTEKFVFEFMDMLTAPIITFSTSWADAIPKHLKEDIQLSRLFASMQNEELASIPETVAYIMTRTYEAPMSHEWTNIYLWCSSKYLKQYRKKTDEDLKEIPIHELNEYEQGLLKKLRVWIYEKRRECVKMKLKYSDYEKKQCKTNIF